MAKMNIRLLVSEPIAEGTMAFWWEKPAGFEYTAGQFGDYTEIEPAQTDAEGPTREFSFITAPHDERIGFASRMRDSAFKRTLRMLRAGDEIIVDAPYGDLRLHNNAARAAIFLTGGIGITPVRSILRDAAYRKLPHKLFLFYSNHRPEDAAFLDELTDLPKENPNFKFVATMTKVETSSRPWSGERGYIDEAMLKRHLGSSTDAIYYLTGPARMISGMRTVLERMGVDRDDVRTEEFSGYS